MEDEMDDEVTGRRVRLWIAYDRGRVTGGMFIGTVVEHRGLGGTGVDGLQIKLDRGGVIGIQPDDGEPPTDSATKLLDRINRVAVAA
jgi:hypothetical protein